jgi:hypothetical protein
MKYKITLGGRGADIYVHRLNEEQHKLLKEGEVEKEKIDMDDIAKILEKEMVDESDEIYTGVYDNDDIVVQVLNESDEMIFDSLSDEDWTFDVETRDEYENYESFAEGDDPILFVESYSKGTFFTFEVETDEEFDESKISPIITEIGERFEMITGLCYKGEVLEKEFDDYWSKGYYYHLT